MIERPLSVRHAEPKDEDGIYRLLLKLHADNSIGFPYDEDRVRESIRLGTERKGGIVAVIEDPDKPGEFAASIGIAPSQFWYSNQHYLHEVWLFVSPEYRKGTTYANDLMQYAKWVKERFSVGAPEPVPFFTSVSSRRRLKEKMRWWGRRGELIGAIYLLR